MHRWGWNFDLGVGLEGEGFGCGRESVRETDQGLDPRNASRALKSLSSSAAFWYADPILMVIAKPVEDFGPLLFALVHDLKLAIKHVEVYLLAARRPRPPRASGCLSRKAKCM
jgi:hypothetical protein